MATPYLSSRASAYIGDGRFFINSDNDINKVISRMVFRILCGDPLLNGYSCDAMSRINQLFNLFLRFSLGIENQELLYNEYTLSDMEELGILNIVDALDLSCTSIVVNAAGIYHEKTGILVDSQSFLYLCACPYLDYIAKQRSKSVV